MTAEGIDVSGERSAERGPSERCDALRAGVGRRALPQPQPNPTFPRYDPAERLDPQPGTAQSLRSTHFRSLRQSDRTRLQIRTGPVNL